MGVIPGQADAPPAPFQSFISGYKPPCRCGSTRFPAGPVAALFCQGSHRLCLIKLCTYTPSQKLLHYSVASPTCPPWCSGKIISLKAWGARHPNAAPSPLWAEPLLYHHKENPWEIKAVWKPNQAWSQVVLVCLVLKFPFGKEIFTGLLRCPGAFMTSHQEVRCELKKSCTSWSSSLAVRTRWVAWNITKNLCMGRVSPLYCLQPYKPGTCIAMQRSGPHTAVYVFPEYIVIIPVLPKLSICGNSK